MNKNYYGTEFYGTEKWEEQKKGILAEMREKYRNVNVEDVDILETMAIGSLIMKKKSKP